jgi:transposase-like protein
MSFFTCMVARRALSAFGFLALTAGTQAQTLNGIRIGEEITTASQFAGKPTSRVVAGPHEEVRWRLPDGNKLALATDPGNGRIAYAEETWGGRPDGKPADFPGFRYGETSLADIRMHAENNGFAFVERLIDERPDGLRLFNSYEVEGSPGLVVTFVDFVANTLFQSFSYCSLSSAMEGGVFKGRHFDRSVILLCVRWYLAYNLSLRNLEEMMTERGISVDHATIHRWIIRYSPELLERFNSRKRAVTGKWHVDETYIKVRGQWRYLYRAIDSNGDTVEFWFSERRNLSAAKRFLRRALKRHGRPKRIIIDGSQTNKEAILSCDTADRLQNRSRRDLKPIHIRQSAYLNNRIEQDHRAIKRRIRPMLGFKSTKSARVILGGIEMVHMMRKQQGNYARNLQPSLAEQFELLAA